jgi:hypothetical protein
MRLLASLPQWDFGQSKKILYRLQVWFQRGCLGNGRCAGSLS